MTKGMVNRMSRSKSILLLIFHKQQAKCYGTSRE
uniref:Uncharacterized protein n=1 Tax=Arundo donax TaxID=35708 RepID=A0A0A9BJD3_ARUDO